MELLRSERDGPVAVGGVPQHGEGSPDLRDWNDLDALGWHRVYRHAGRTVPVVEQDLREQATEGVAHDDRRALQLAYDTLVVLDDCGDRQRLDRGGVLVQRLYLYLQAGVGRSEHAIAAALVALDPVLPASWGHPEPVDQDDGVWSTRIRGVVLGGHGDVLSRRGRLAKTPERGPELLGRQLRLFPGGEVAAPVDRVEVGEGTVRLLDPAARGRPDLVREGSEAHRDRDFGRSLGSRGRDSGGSVALPVRPGGRGPGARQPVQRDVVEDVVPGEIARRLPRGEGAGHLVVAVGVVVEHPGRQGDG